MLTATCLDSTAFNFFTILVSMALTARSSVRITSPLRLSSPVFAIPGSAENPLDAIKEAICSMPFPAAGSPWEVRKVYCSCHSLSFWISSFRFRKSQKLEIRPDLVKGFPLMETIPTSTGSYRSFKLTPRVTLFTLEVSVFICAMSF